jgi:hypothetical protein
MTTSENHVETDAERTRWWMFWRVLPTRLRRRRSRLSDEANSDATSFWIRGGF